MKILLDECLPRQVKAHLRPHYSLSVSEAGWSNFKNGALIKIAIEHGFEVLLTSDKNIEYQQNVSSYNISIVILDVQKNNMACILPLVPLFLSRVTEFEKGKTYVLKLQ